MHNQILNLKKYILLKYILLFVVFSLVNISPVFSLNWTENTKQSFEDGYFYRSTVTADGKIKVRQWDDWWNTAWPQRIPIEINNVGNQETLQDYQIWFVFNSSALVSAGKLDQNGTSIRITDEDGKTLLPFWIENWNLISSTGSKVWVRIPTIPADSKKYIYMYIRYTSTNSVSNRDTVFDLYEDWETGRIRTQTPWSDTGWVYGGNGVFEIHASTDLIYNFTTQTYETFNVLDGRYAVRSGVISHSQSTFLQTSISLSYPARIEMYWACFSEGGNYDYLGFYLGAQEQGRIQGESGWRFAAFNLPSGNSILRWVYIKDNSGTAYYDRGFIDKIIVRKYNSLFDSQIQQRISLQNIEEYSPYYKYAEYYSNVFDTQGENTTVVYTSWTEVLNGQTVEIYVRSSDIYFSMFSTFPAYTANKITNNSNPSGIILPGRYIQYKIKLYTDGTTTPEVSNINFTYLPIPLRAYDFNGVALSSTSIKWSWTNRATYYIDGYRIYSSTRQYNKDGGYLVITSTSDGLIAELSADTTYWIEENLQPNTQYGRYVVAYTTTIWSFAGNASRSITGRDEPRYVYTLALPPSCKPEKYVTNTTTPPYYEFIGISTGIWYNTKEFSFTSELSTGPGKIAYYRYVFATTSTWNDNISNVWYPSSQTYITGGGEQIVERPILNLVATENSQNWFFQVKSYNGDSIESGYQIFGPFWFKGCPSQITDLVVSRGSGEEGCIILKWTTPTDDADGGDLVGAKYVVKYRLAGIIDTDSKFDAISPVSTSTGMVAGTIIISTNSQAGSSQTYIVTGLVPGLTYWFAIRTVDNNDNKSAISTYLDPSTGLQDITKLRSRSSKVSRIEFITPSYTFYAGDVSPKIEVKLLDEDGNEIKTKFGGECDLLTTSSKGSFSLDGINFGINKLNILPGTSKAIFYYMDENSGSPEIKVDEIAALQSWNGEQGWGLASQVHTILPGKAVTFRVIPQNGDYNCQIVVDKPVYVEAVDKLGNVAVDFEGVVVVTSTFAGLSIEPSNITFNLSDQGRVSAILRNFYYAGASSVTVYEVLSQDYKKMFFKDYYNGYVVGNKGMLKATAEGGNRWFTKLYRNNLVLGLNGIAVNENDVAVLCGKNGLVIHSTNSFVNYTEKNITSNDLQDITFVDQNTVVICGNAGIIFKSTDTGLNFYPINSAVNVNLNSVVFVSTSVGFICGDNGKILKTTNKADSFSELNSGVNVNLYGMEFIDEQNGFVCGANSTILKTDDSGTSFTATVISTENITLYGIDFITSQIGVVCGSSSKVFISTNSGNSFYDISPQTETPETFYTIKMLDNNKIIVAGSNGSMYLTNDKGKTWQKITMQGGSPQNYLWNATIISSIETKATRVVQGRQSQIIATVGLKFQYPSNTLTKINKITVQKLGSLPDNYITSLKVSDLGQGSFINGIAEILLPSQPTIKYTTTYFDILIDLSPEAPLDTTFALKFNFGCVNVSQGIQFGRNNLPYITYKDTTTLEYLIVVPPVVNVYVVNVDSSVYLRTYTGLQNTTLLEQGDSAVVLKFGLITDKSVSPFRKLRVNLSGNNIRDEDIKVVKLYSEVPFFEPNLVSSATFSGGIALFDFIEEQTISDKATNYYYLTCEISPEASYSRDNTEVNFSFRIDLSTSYFLLDTEGVNTISSKLVDIQGALRTRTTRIEVSRDIVYVRQIPDLVAKIPEKVYQSETIVLLPLAISVGKRGLGTAAADWSRLTVAKSTDASDNYNRFERSSWTIVTVWRDDNGNGVLEPLVDTKLGNSRFENSVSVVIFEQPEKIEKQEYLGEYTTYFISCYIPKNAQPNEKLKIFLDTGTYLTLGGVDVVNSDNFPLVSPEVIIADWPDEVEFEPTSLAPYEAALYEQDVPLAKFDFLAFCDATLDKLVITHEGTSEASSTVKMVKVYLDDGDLRFDNTKDVVVASGTFDISGKCELNFFNPNNQLKYKPVLILDEKVRVFITFDFNEDATPDKTIGFGIDPSGLTYNLPNRQKPFGYFSTSKILLLDKRTPTKPVINPYVPLPEGIDTGKEVEKRIYYTPYSNEISFNWYSEAPHGGGIKCGYAGISLSRPTSSKDTPEIVPFITISEVGDYTLSGLNLSHNKVYYLWIKSESNAGFERINYVTLFVDNTEPQSSNAPQATLPSNGVYWLNCNLVDDAESFILSADIEEKTQQELTWNRIATVDLKIQDMIKDIYFGRIKKEIKDSQIIFSTRCVLSDDVVVEYTFNTLPQQIQQVEVVNFDTLFAAVGYKLQNYNIKLEYRVIGRENNKVYHYRIKTKNAVNLYSAPSETSKSVYLSLPNRTILELTTYPNPCDVRKKNLGISYILTEDAEVNIKLFDLFGNLVYQENYPLGEPNTTIGVHYLELKEAKNLPAGMYIFVLQTKNKNGEIDTKKWKLGIIR